MVLAFLSVTGGMGHHVDHIIRGNHVGWPLTAEVTPFTISFIHYVLLAVVIYLYQVRKFGPLVWGLLAAFGTLFQFLLHFGWEPILREPPIDIIEPYTSPFAGKAALVWVMSHILILIVTTVYAFQLAWRESRPSETSSSESSESASMPAAHAS